MKNNKPQLLSRSSAIEGGIKFFYTGEPCIHGHVCNRYTSNRVCVLCAKAESSQRWNDVKHVSGLRGDGPYCPVTPMSRQEAMLAGLDYYFTGDKCTHGHIYPRKVSNHTCVQCQLNSYHHNKTKYSNIQKKRRESNPDVISLLASQRWKKKKHTKEEKALRAAERRRNKSTRNHNDGMRRARKMLAAPKWKNDLAIKEIYETASTLSTSTGIPHHVHHVVPLQACSDVCGLHWEQNLLVLPESVHKDLHSNQTLLRELW